MQFHKRSRHWSASKVHGACLMGCGVLLALAGVAFSISSDLVGPAAAQADQRWGGAKQPVLAALPAVDDSVHNLFPVSRRPVAPLPRSVVPVLISRVPDVAPVSVVTAAETESPDADEWVANSVQPWTPERPGTYRTVCVRLCDGAFFPVSFATTRDRFKADAAKCKSACGTPAKLFVGPPDGSAEDLVDVRGSSYADLPNAFKFRSSYDAACTCKGQPWEIAERERHTQLAAVAHQSLPPSVEADAVGLASPPLVAKVETGSTAVVKPVARMAATEGVRRGAVRSPAARAATHTDTVQVAVAGRAITTKQTVTSKKRVVKEIGIAAVPPKAVARLDSASMQRPFRAHDYWRLSYWDATNF